MRLTCVSTNVGQRVKSGGSNVKPENAPDSHVITSTLFHSKTVTTSSKKDFKLNFVFEISKFSYEFIRNNKQICTERCLKSR